VHTRSGRHMAEMVVGDKTTVAQFKNNFHIKCPKYYPERQRFTFGPAPGTALADTKILAEYNLKDGDVLTFKDLGPQIGWGTVFFIEYFGPLLIYPLFYFGAEYIYSEPVKAHHQVQFVALLCWSLHYLKRIYETLFVHRFSHSTMPLLNLFKNCAHYWGAAIMISYFVNHPLFTPPPQERFYAGLGLFIAGEVGNFITHQQLRALRPAGSNERAIPRGFLFEFVSCPNYTFETMAWTGFSVMTQTLTSYLFLLLGAGQMYMWAVAKHRRYRKEFDGKEGRPLYPRGRKAMFPLLL